MVLEAPNVGARSWRLEAKWLRKNHNGQKAEKGGTHTKYKKKYI